MSIAQIMSGTPARYAPSDFTASNITATNVVVSNNLTVRGVPVQNLDNLSIPELITEIRRRITELETFCQALSEAIYIGPLDPSGNPVVFPSPA